MCNVSKNINILIWRRRRWLSLLIAEAKNLSEKWWNRNCLLTSIWWFWIKSKMHFNKKKIEAINDHFLSVLKNNPISIHIQEWNFVRQILAGDWFPNFNQEWYWQTQFCQDNTDIESVYWLPICRQGNANLVSFCQ